MNESIKAVHLAHTDGARADCIYRTAAANDGAPRVVSGESGAVTTGLVAELMQNTSLDYLRESIGLGKDARILCISTEGDTDRTNYRRVVWDGLYPSF